MSTIYKFQKCTGRFSNVLGTFTYELGKCEERFYYVFITNLNVTDIFQFLSLEFYKNILK